MKNLRSEEVLAENTVEKYSVYQAAIKQFSHYNNKAYHYLDSAATSQKPDCVIDAVTQGYRHFCAPVHRASYPLSETASTAYENSRACVAQFINAPAPQLIFTKSCTESINQVALGWATSAIKQQHKTQPKIWLSRMEHNANYLPWHQLCQTTGAQLNIIEMNDNGRLLIEQENIWHQDTFLIAITHCSNVLGGENPIQAICDKAREKGIYTLVDAAQSVSHLPIDVQKLGCDFLAFSAHKMYGPEGIGALYMKQERMAEMSPLLLGGGIIEAVDEQHMTLREAPYCFEAGSLNLSGALGFAAAVKFLQSFPADAVSHYIGDLGKQFRQALAELPNVTLMPIAGGGADNSENGGSSVISFMVDQVHPHDVAHIAAENGVAIRTGHHCSHLLLNHLNIGALNRLSLGVYNNSDDIEPLIKSIKLASDIFA